MWSKTCRKTSRSHTCLSLRGSVVRRGITETSLWLWIYAFFEQTKRQVVLTSKHSFQLLTICILTFSHGTEKLYRTKFGKGENEQIELPSRIKGACLPIAIFHYLQLTVRMMLAKVLQKFDFRLHPSQELSFQERLTLTPKNGLQVIFNERKSFAK